MQNYIFSNDFYKNIDLMVYTSGHEKCEPSHSYGPVVRTSYMFHYIHKGKGIYQCRGKTFHLKAGDMFLMIPQERIYYEADKDDPWEYSWIGLKGLKAEETIGRSTLLEDLVIHLPEDSRIPSIFSRLQAGRMSENSDLLYNSCAWDMVYQLSQEAPAPKNPNDLSAADYVELILTYVEQHFEEPISVQEIADHLSLDRSYVHRIFKKKMNMSVKEYILSLRLANACSYLIYTDLPISDIARSVGYEDVLYFSKLFKKKKGLSPSQYREIRKKEYAELHAQDEPEEDHSQTGTV